MPSVLLIVWIVLPALALVAGLVGIASTRRRLAAPISDLIVPSHMDEDTTAAAA